MLVVRGLGWCAISPNGRAAVQGESRQFYAAGECQASSGGVGGCHTRHGLMKSLPSWQRCYSVNSLKSSSPVFWYHLIIVVSYLLSMSFYFLVSFLPFSQTSLVSIESFNQLHSNFVQSRMGSGGWKSFLPL